MTLDRQFAWNLPFTLETVEDCIQYIRDHYAEHQEESALRITDFNIFHDTMGAFTVKQNSDTIEISHDGTDAYIKWSAGHLILLTDEGANTDTNLDIKGKGTGSGVLALYDQDDAEHLDFWTSSGVGKIRVSGAAPGEIRIGGATDYASFEQDGEINLAGTAKVTRHLRVGAGSWKNGASAPSPGLWGIFPTLDFDTDSDDDAHYTLIVPHRWDGTTDIKIVVDWAHEVASVAGVTWALEYKGIKAGEAIAGGTATLTEPSGASVINVMQRTVFDPCIDADLLEAEDTLALRFYRDVSDAGDTLPGDARLLNVHFHFTMDKLGEAT